MNKAPETLTYEESNTLLNAAKTTHKGYWSGWKNHRNYTMILVMLDAGLRIGEVARLKIHDCVMNGEPVSALAITGDNAEKKCERIIPLTPRLNDAFAVMNKTFWGLPGINQGDFAFFSNDTHEAISPRQIERIVILASTSGFGRAIRAHVLRHTFATRLMRVTSTAVVQQLLGHKNLSSTQVYVHPNGDDLKLAINKM